VAFHPSSGATVSVTFNFSGQLRSAAWDKIGKLAAKAAHA